MTWQQAKDVTLALLVIGMFALAAAGLLTAKHLDSDEVTSCHVQSVGLPASHDLAAALKDQAELDALDVSPVAVQLEVGFNTHLDAYLALEGKQPTHRTC